MYYILGLAALILLSLTILAVQPALAQDQGQDQTQDQGQGEATPGAARVSLIHGDVSSMRGDSGDWVAVTVNAPLVLGDKIATGDKSQAEIQLDYANVLRLAPGTEVKIADLSRTRIQLQVSQGLVNLTVFKGTEADVEIDTPNMAVAPLGEGSYRIQVNSPSDTQLIVRKGQAQVSTPDGSTQVDDGRMINVRGTDHPEYQIASGPHNDDWDKWNQERDKDIYDAQSYQHANRYTPARRTWIAAATGFKSPITTGAGPLMSMPAGCRTETGPGSGSPIGAGRGFLTNPGAGRLTTTGDGSLTVVPGTGGRATAPTAITRLGRRRTSPSSALASAGATGALVSASGTTPSAGARWDPTTGITPGGGTAIPTVR
jgi:hypothetical protein